MSQDQSSDAADIERAKRNAELAKARVQTTAGALKQRLHPRTIASDAADTVREKTDAIGEAARNRPAAAGAAAGVAALVVFRKPVGKLFKRLFSSKAKAKRRERKSVKVAAKLRDQAARQQERATELAARTPMDSIQASANDAAHLSAKQE